MWQLSPRSLTGSKQRERGCKKAEAICSPARRGQAGAFGYPWAKRGGAVARRLWGVLGWLAMWLALLLRGTLPLEERGGWSA